MEIELHTNLLTGAIIKAFQQPKKQAASVVDDDDDEIIDTTQPEFAEKFQGFTNIPQPTHRVSRNRNTEVRRG